MKLAASIITLNGDYVLDAIIETLYDFFSKIIIVEGPVGYFSQRGITHSTDRTVEVVRSFPDPQRKIHLVSGQWPEKTEMCNAALPYIPDDTNFIWHIDDDECHYPEVIEEVIHVLETGKVDSISFRSLTFFGGFDRIFDVASFEQGQEFQRIQRWQSGSRWATHRPPTICAIGDGRPWREHDHLAFYRGMPHYSYVWPKRVLDKTTYYRESVAPGRCIPDYFNRVYLPWVLGNDAQKQAIENQFNGTHDFLPETRGPCRTTPFIGPHPPAIEKRLPQLRERLRREIEAYAH